MPPLHDHILPRLTATGADAHDWSYLVLAALDGPEALAKQLAGSSAPAPRPAARVATPAAATEPPGIYVSSITVEGFRGVGPAATLPLAPGPGLTLVVGRNGSGKSSFAEGLELLLTGHNLRWDGRSKEWARGWRNLHQSATTVVSAGLVVEDAGPLVARRAWAADADWAASQVELRDKQKKRLSLDSLGWSAALATFRPFLSYNELGSILDDGPSKAYDALAPVLGLDDFVTVQRMLSEARKALDEQLKALKGRATSIALTADQVAAAHPQEARAVHLASKLKARTWDLAALRTLAAGGSDITATVLDALRRLATLIPPDVDAVQAAVHRLRAAAAGMAAHQGTDAARSLARARLLQQALGFHEAHATRETACPVCGTANACDGEWLTRCRDEIAVLNAEASAVQTAENHAKSALAAAHALVSEVAKLPPPAAGQMPSMHQARMTQEQWLKARLIDAPLPLADHLESSVLELHQAVTDLTAEAASEIAKREDVWRPLGAALAQWLAEAERLANGKQHLDDLKAAEDWWKDATDAVRTERFKPIADRAIATWRALRLQSNVDIGGVTLESSGTRRKVSLDVTVDGTPADALGVMSQGELHSLALSLFLPRATLPDSPFRFICVDDPVQSMDPSRVEGLARVLADTAKTRQVIVFTHDDRLPEAVRRLGLHAHILRVTRRAQSVVEVTPALDPAQHYIAEAKAIVKTQNLPRDVAARVVPGFCRMAVEAACVAVVRKRRLLAGALHDDVERLLDEHGTLYPRVALALFDDASRTADVLASLRRQCGAWAVDAFTGCNRGAHEAHEGDLELLVQDAGRLAAKIAGMS